MTTLQSFLATFWSSSLVILPGTLFWVIGIVATLMHRNTIPPWVRVSALTQTPLTIPLVLIWSASWMLFGTTGEGLLATGLTFAVAAAVMAVLSFAPALYRVEPNPEVMEGRGEPFIRTVTRTTLLLYACYLLVLGGVYLSAA